MEKMVLFHNPTLMVFCLIINLFAHEVVYAFNFWGLGSLFGIFKSRHQTSRRGNSNISYDRPRTFGRLTNEEMISIIERLSNPGGDRVLNGEVLNEETAEIVVQQLREELHTNIIRPHEDLTPPTMNSNIIPMDEMAQIEQEIERLEQRSSTTSATTASSSKPASEGLFGRMKSYTKCVSILSTVIGSCEVTTKNVAITSGGRDKSGQNEAKQNNNNYAVECPICLDNMLLKETLVSPQCGHLFCDECIRKWITESNGACPNCQTPIQDLRQILFPQTVCTKKQRFKAAKKALRDCKKMKKEGKTIDEIKAEKGYKKYKFRCSVCSYDFTSEDGRAINSLRCGHVLCSKCINQDIVKTTKKCPVCKMKVDSTETRIIHMPNISHDD